MALSNKLKTGALSLPIKPPISVKVEKRNWLKTMDDLRKRLWEITAEEVNNDIMIRFDYEKKGIYNSGNTVYANPVFMATFLKEYELIRVLLDKGHKAIADKKQYLAFMSDMDKEETEHEWGKEIQIYQLVLLDESIPDDILKRIFEEVYEKRKGRENILDFKADIDFNPFFYGSDRLADIRLALNSVERIKKMDKKYVHGMLKHFDSILCLPEDEKDLDIYEKIFSIFGKEEDIVNVIREVINVIFVEEYICSAQDGCPKKDYHISEFWQKLVPAIKSVCQQNESIAKHVAILYFDKFRELGKTRKKNLIRRYILPICKDLEFDEKAAKYLDIEHIMRVFDYIISWKETFGGKIVWKRYNENYINLMAKGSGDLWAYELEKCRENLRFLACIDEIDKEQKPLSVASYTKEIGLMDNILDLNNEEIIMIMLEKGYYSGELLDELITRSLKTRHVSLVPMLIYYREKEKENKVCIQ